MAKPKPAEQVIEINHIPVPENLIPLTFENADQFIVADPESGELTYPFLGIDPVSNEPYVKNLEVVWLDPEVVVKETQPAQRTGGSGLTLGKIEELKKSIQGSGQITPIALRAFKLPDTADEAGNIVAYGEIQYHLLAGLRRDLACMLAKEESDLKEFPICGIVHIVDQEGAELIALHENVMREDLSPAELTVKIGEALDRHKGNVSKAAEELNLPRTSVSPHKQIWDAMQKDPTFKAQYASGQFGYETALSLSKNTPEERAAIVGKAVQIETAKADAQLKQVAATAQAKGLNPAAAVADAKTAAAKTALDPQAKAATRSPLANLMKGAVSSTTVKQAEAEVKGTVKPKALTGKAIAEMFTMNYGSNDLFKGPVKAFVGYFSSWILGELGDDGEKMVTTSFEAILNPALKNPQNVVAVANPKAAAKTAAPAPVAQNVTNAAAPAAAAPVVAVAKPKLVLRKS